MDNHGRWLNTSVHVGPVYDLNIDPQLARRAEMRRKEARKAFLRRHVPIALLVINLVILGIVVILG